MKSLQILACILALSATLLWPATALARGPAGPLPPAGYTAWCVKPPRFQIFQAPKPYGGLLMVDTQTGESWQRIVVNTPKGIAIRWMKLERKGVAPGESILWD
jgi:hypothetical protein